MAESSRWLTVNMHAYARYANDRLWPEADIETKSKWVFLNVRFGEKSGRSEPTGIPPRDYTELHKRPGSILGARQEVCPNAFGFRMVRGGRVDNPRFIVIHLEL